jgi:hypothetical protein
MPIPTVKVKNLTNHVLHLKSADRDSVSIMPKANAVVHLKFVDWQTPSPKTLFIDQVSLSNAKKLKASLNSTVAA